MIWHEVWLWLWYVIGSLLYMVKRAFYGIQPPNRVATDPINYIHRAGIPLLFRFGFEGAVFWTMFTPAIATKAITFLGGESYVWVIQVVTQFAPAAFVTGLAIDPLADWFIPTVIGRIPGLKDWWPQMPGPLPQEAVVRAEVVEQTTKVTQLQTTTTTIPEQSKETK